MSQSASPSLARQLGSLFEGGCTAGLSDRQLLERFTARGEPADEAAFAAIVARHGPMVLGVCRQLLGDHQHAEDAFQAVFLVLAQKARSIRDPDLLGAWLYGVALRTARKARARLARRRQTEEDGAVSRPEAQPAVQAEQTIEREQAEALHREIDRLPGSFRLPVVLCYFEGLSPDEAARRLRWPSGTLRCRLVRAREKLRRELSRRGFALSTMALAPRSIPASLSPLLCDSTTRAAIAFAFAARPAAGGALSAPATALAQEVLRTMLWHKLKVAALSLLLLATLAAGAGYLNAFARSREGEPPGEPRLDPARTEPRPPDSPRPPEGRMTVTGRVLDPQGKPIASARIAALADRKPLVGDRDGRHRNILTGTAAADAEGRFTMDVTAIAASRLEHLALIAAAPGRAFTVVDLKTDAERQEASITLPPETPVEGRLVDVQGQPAVGVVVRVAKLNLQHELQPYDAKGAPSLWPSPATTDRDGRFRLPGLGADVPATYEVEDPRYAHQRFSFQASASGEGKEVLRPGSTVTLRPSQTFEVRVVHSDDGTPAVGARVSVQSVEGYYPRNDFAHARTDHQGRARVVGWPAGEHRVRIDPPEGEPYLPASDDIEWPKAAVQKSVEFKLRRGVVVRGRVTEDPAGTPVAGAWAVYHQTHRDNPRYTNLPGMEVVSGLDGTFTMVVPRGPGHVLVQGPGDDYLHVEANSSDMGLGLRPSFHLYPDAHAVLDITDGEATYPLELKLRRGVTVAGRVVGPDGKPVAEAFVFGRSYTPYREGDFPLVGFNGWVPQIDIKDGRFEIHGCDPEKPGTFYFLDTKDRLGATVELSGKSAASRPITVRLRPTATARILMKDAAGKPLANHEPGDWPNDLRLVITPGPDFGELNGNIDLTPGDFAYQTNFLPDHGRNLRSGPDGRATMVNLIPGARYRFGGREFTPKPGQTVDLDIVVKKPAG